METRKTFLGSEALAKLIDLIHGLFTGLTGNITTLTTTVNSNKAATDAAIEAETTRATAAEKANSDKIDSISDGLVGPNGDVSTLNGLAGRVTALEEDSHEVPAEMTTTDVQTAWDAVFGENGGN